MIVSLLQFYHTLKGQSSNEVKHAGTCTTQHLIGKLHSKIPAKLFSYKSVVNQNGS